MHFNLVRSDITGKMFLATMFRRKIMLGGLHPLKPPGSWGAQTPTSLAGAAPLVPLSFWVESPNDLVIGYLLNLVSISE